MESTLQKTSDPLGALRITEFRHLMIGRFLFIMGLRMMGTLVGWWIYELTNEPFAIGLIGLSEVIPAVSLALYAGHVIDKSEKRKLLLRGGCTLLDMRIGATYTVNQNRLRKIKPITNRHCDLFHGILYGNYKILYWT